MLSVKQFASTLRMRKPSNVLFDMDVSLPMPVGVTSGHLSFYRTSRWLCLLTTCIAFVLGVGVGVAVPFYVFPSSNSSIVQQPGLPSSSNLSTIGDRQDFSWPTVENRSTTPAPLPTISVPYAQMRVKKTDNELDTEEIEHHRKISFVQPQEVRKHSSSSSEHSYVPITTPEPRESFSSDVVQGIYWTDMVEDMLPRGFVEEDVVRWQEYCQDSPVVRLDEGCGRMQNRLVTFENGTKSCCRYRQNYDQIQGEIFSFYLSRLLGLRNLPPSALGLVRPLESQWTNVRSQLSLAQWAEDRPVVLTQFLEGLEPALIPVLLRGSNRHFHPTDVALQKLDSVTDREQLVTLAQWSDLLVFDYLTANLDRVVNNLYNMQWNPAMMESPAHNLARDPKTGLLLFLDNESGLLHGYRLLDKYEVYHKSLLESVCVFRKTTVDSLRKLQSKRNVGDLLRNTFESRHENVVDYLPFLPEKSVKTLNHRIDRVLDQVAKCESLYGS